MYARAWENKISLSVSERYRLLTSQRMASLPLPIGNPLFWLLSVIYFSNFLTCNHPSAVLLQSMCIHKLQSVKSAFSLFFLIFYQNYEPRKKIVNVILTRTVMELIFDSLDFRMKKNGSFFILLPENRACFFL